MKYAENLRSNLLDVHSKMQYLVKDKITNILASVFQIPAPTKSHYWFALFFDPWYVMEIKDIKYFQQSENMDTKTRVQQMMPKFYEYIMATELAVNPYTPQILVGNK